MPTVEANGVETYYERHGDGQPVVFAHGGGWDCRSWAPQIASHLTDDYELIIYDIRGHGNSGAPPVEDYSIELLAADLKELVDTLNLDRPAVGGLSLGGMIAHTYAAEYPESLSALVAAEARVSGTMSRSQRALLTAFKPIASVFGIETIYTLQSWISKVRGSDTTEDDTEIEELDQQKMEYIREAASHLSAAQYFRMLSDVMDFEASLEVIEVPTLVITGDDPHDVIVDARDAMVDEVADVRVCDIPDAGHAANLDNPPAFNTAVGDFLDDVYVEEPSPTA